MAEENGTEENGTDVEVNSLANIISYAQDSNPTQLKAELGTMIGSKIMDRIETRRQEISADMFGQ